jgi:hypothetical protein
MKCAQFYARGQIGRDQLSGDSMRAPDRSADNAKSGIEPFAANRSGTATVQTALLFGGIALAAAVLAAPLLQGAAGYYAQNRAFGIDRVMTGGIAKGERVTIRKSVLSGEAQVICDAANAKSCVSR